MNLYVFRRRQATKSGLVLGLFVLAFVLALQARGIERRAFGIKEGVTLEHQAVGRLLPSELVRLIEQISPAYEREPQNAMFFGETGQVIPERSGLKVDITATVLAVRQAKPRTQVRLVTRPIPAAVTTDYFTPVFRGAQDRQEVALAINVAWGEECLPGMLEILKKDGVKASFFFIGDWVEKFPELVRAVAADGHEIGNHGLYHGHPCAVTRAELTRMILDNNALLAKVIGRPSAPLFAPPAGEFDQRSVGIAAELGYRTILWTVDTIDWKRPSPDLIRSRVANKVVNGAIVLMHPTAPTLAALPNVLQDLRAKGYKLVTVGQLLR